MLTNSKPKTTYPSTSPEVEIMVRQVIDRVADKWTMLVLEALEEHGRLRFTKLSEVLGDVSQKMLTRTLRNMESDGLVERTVYPVVPPRVEYELTDLGHGLTEAFCGVWQWVEANHERVLKAREAFNNINSSL